MFQGKFVVAKKDRPAEVGHWFQYGRRWDKMPLVAQDELGRYSEDWWKWWGGLQPDFRGKDLKTMSRVVNAPVDWTELLKGGPNGLFVILLTLGWWYIGVEFAGGDLKDFNHAVSDVLWVLDQIKSSDSLKRKRADKADHLSETRIKKRYGSIVLSSHVHY